MYATSDYLPIYLCALHNKNIPQRYSWYTYYKYIDHDGFRQRKNTTITFTIINFSMNILTIITIILK